MNTPSHFLMTAALRKAVPNAGIVTSAFLVGSIAPDIPLYLLSVGGVLYFNGYLGWPMDETFERMYDYLFFNDPGWIAAHNVFHAPLVLIAVLALSWRFGARGPGVSGWLYWFAAAALLHTLVDVFTHRGDGPLLFWPFDWSYRYESPVSYWDPAYYGRPFMVFEAVLDIGLTVYLVGPWVRGRLARREG